MHSSVLHAFSSFPHKWPLSLTAEVVHVLLMRLRWTELYAVCIFHFLRFCSLPLWNLSLPPPLCVCQFWICRQTYRQTNKQNAAFVITWSHYALYKQYPRVRVACIVYYQYPAKEPCVFKIASLSDWGRSLTQSSVLAVWWLTIWVG